MKRALLAIVTLVAAHCMAQTEVNTFSPGKNEGVTYALPDTEIEITITATCITRTPGEFSKYAERYLRINDAITEHEDRWTIDGIEIGTAGVPNPEKTFTIKLNNSTASNITLGANGVIESINCEPLEEKPTKPSVTTHKGNTKESASLYMTGEMLQATSTAKLAELTAKQIYDIRESRGEIIRGEADNMPRDGDAMKLVMEQFDKEEKALIELFTGRTDTIYKSIKISLKPRSEECDTTDAILFRFSHKFGILDKEDLAGDPVYYSIKDLKSVETRTEVKKPLKKEGICYNVPGSARLEIYTRGRRLASKVLSIAQLGTTEILSKDLFKKNNHTKVLFDRKTGGIISITKQ